MDQTNIKAQDYIRSACQKMSNTIQMSLLIFIIAIFLLSVPVFNCYGQEQDIAESFGLCSKGINYYQTGKLHEAKDILEQAVRLDPRNDGAKGYLILVNAEIIVRKKGRLDTYQDITKLIRERDFGYKIN
jgi:tetratricopeptide (TPR) repeat protein